METSQIITNAVKAFQPPPPLTVSEWADAYRYISGKTAADPGRWRTAKTPYLREIQDCVTDDRIERIAVMKATRMGGTEFINNAIGYHIHYDPCPILYVQTALDEGRKYSDRIFTPMIEVTPVLSDRVGITKESKTKLSKSFPGGNLDIVGAKSPKGFRMVTKRLVICDDIDGYDNDVGGEGDPIKLAEGRANTFWNRKLIHLSNPTVKDASKIEALFLDSDQRFRHVPCPHCGALQILVFGNKDTAYGIKWKDRDHTTAHYVCEHCLKEIKHHNKTKMDQAGEWIASKPFNGTAGFHLSKLLSPWYPWSAIVKDFLDAKGDPSKLMVFVNQTLAETWEDAKTLVDHHALYDRREDYRAQVPQKACVLTAGVDTQDDRLEVEVVGWGRGEESWGIEHRVFVGSPAEQSVWDALDRFLMKGYQHESGINMRISAVCIDTQGHYASQVYSFVKPREIRQVYGIKGANVPGAPLVANPTTSNLGKIKLYMVGVDSAKDILFGRLRIEEEGPGYCHFPMHYDEEWFRQVTAEKVIIQNGKRKWIPIIGRKNEALDMRNYALAALQILRPDWDQLSIGDLGDMINERRIYYNHDVSKHLKEIEIEKNQPIIVCCDFQVNPMVWPVCQTDGRKVRVVGEITQRNSNTLRMGQEVMKRYREHKKGIIIYGSATGTIRQRGKSDYALLMDLGMRTQRVKRMNPLEQDRINAVNMMFEDQDENIRLEYSQDCIELRKDFEQGQWKEDGTGIDDTDFGRGNASTALSYFIEYMFPLKVARKTGRRFLK